MSKAWVVEEGPLSTSNAEKFHDHGIDPAGAVYVGVSPDPLGRACVAGCYQLVELPDGSVYSWFLVDDWVASRCPMEVTRG